MPDCTGKDCDESTVSVSHFPYHCFYFPRYGQKREVFCKVYYTPVSIEERLLSWRHRFESQEHIQVDPDATTIFAPIRGVHCEDDEQDSMEELEPQQTEFLLGLQQTKSSVV
jgi:hypothetical protein